MPDLPKKLRVVGEDAPEWRDAAELRRLIEQVIELRPSAVMLVVELPARGKHPAEIQVVSVPDSRALRRGLSDAARDLCWPDASASTE